MPKEKAPAWGRPGLCGVGGGGGGGAERRGGGGGRGSRPPRGVIAQRRPCRAVPAKNETPRNFSERLADSCHRRRLSPVPTDFIHFFACRRKARESRTNAYCRSKYIGGWTRNAGRGHSDR